jgi:sorting nexin-4
MKLQELEQNWAEPLHEYSQFASIIKKILSYRHQKHVQYEMTQDGLESKRERLEDLEKSEREARRLEDALDRGRASNIRPPPRSTQGEGEEEGQIVDAEEPQEAYLPPHPGPNPARRKVSSPGMGLFNALSYTLHGMMDVDPETARRNGISKTRETISSVHWFSIHLTYPFDISTIIYSWRMLYNYQCRILSIPTRLSRRI